MHRFLRSAALIASLLPGLVAQEVSQDPTRVDAKQIENKQVAIAASELDEAAKEEARKQLDGALAQLALEDTARAREKELRQIAAAKAETIAAAERLVTEVEAYGDPVVPEGATSADVEALILERQERRKDAADDLARTEQALAVAVSRRDARSKLRGDLQEEQARLQGELQQLPDQGQPLLVQEASRLRIRAALQKVAADLKRLQAGEETYDDREAILQAQISSAKRRSQLTADRITSLATARDALVRAETIAARNAAEAALREQINQDPLIASRIEQQIKWQDRKLLVGDQRARVQRLVKLLSEENDNLEPLVERTRSQLESVGVAGVGASTLQFQRRRMPVLAEEKSRWAEEWLEVVLPKARRERFELRFSDETPTFDTKEEADIRAEVNRLIDQRMAEGPALDKPEEFRARLSDELFEYSRVYNELLEETNALLDEEDGLGALQKEIERSRELTSGFIGLLDQWLLWTRNTEPIGSLFVRSIGEEARGLQEAQPWSQIPSILLRVPGQHPVSFGLGLILLVLLVGYRRRVRARIKVVEDAARRIATDSIWRTVELLFWYGWLASPTPFVLAMIGRSLRGTVGADGDMAVAVGDATLLAARVLFGFALVDRLFAPKAIGETHFRWRPDTLKVARRAVRAMRPIVPLFAFVFPLGIADAMPDSQDAIDRLAILVLGVGTAVVVLTQLWPSCPIVRHMLEKSPNSWMTRLRGFWITLLVGIPLGLALLAAFGYSFAAKQLGQRILETLGILVAVSLIRSLAWRWSLIAQRRLAIERHKQQAQATEQAMAAPEGAFSEDVAAGLREPEIEISTINEQSRHLIRTTSWVVILVLAYQIWADVMPALGVLDNIRLWRVDTYAELADGTVASEPTLGWITLREVGLAVVVLILSTVAARNLPGVLEIAVLRHLPMSAGSRYATSSVARYVFVGIGLFAAFDTIGIEWSRIQWLMAALGLGLGFGLQEIIANFVSGLILLFERPIRVGDIVSVGDTQGIVSNIKIRATTITNWDQMELLIPNKELVTGRVLNWTLTTSVNRIMIPVGISYSGDVDLARETLLSVAKDHPAVLDEPAPLAPFEKFDNSSLNLSLRCYIADFSNRLNIIHELHAMVLKRFREKDIEIAFPQLDLHIKEVPPRGDA